MQDLSLDFLPASQKTLQHKLAKFKYPQTPSTFEEAVWFAFSQTLHADIDEIRSRVAYFNSQLSLYKYLTWPHIHQKTKQLFLKFFSTYKTDYSFEIPEKAYENLFHQMQLLFPENKIIKKQKKHRQQHTPKKPSATTFTWGLLLMAGQFSAQVIAANQPPIISSAITSFADQNAAPYLLDMLQYAFDPDGDNLTVSNIVLISGDTSGIISPSNVQSNETTKFKITPSAYKFLCINESARIIYQYRIYDTNNAYLNQNATITITGLNDTPTVSGPRSRSTDEDAAPFTQSLLATASDLDTSDTLSVADVTVYQNGTLINEASIIPGVMRTNNTVSVNPSVYNYFSSTDSIQFIYYYNITDNHGAFVNQTFTLTISGRNDNPYLINNNTAISYSSLNGMPITQNSPTFSIDLLEDAVDPDENDELSISNLTLLGGSTKGITTNSTHMIITPSKYNDLGLDSSQQPESITIRYSYRINDGYGGASIIRNLNITILGENDYPTVTNSPLGLLTNEDMAPSSFSLLATASDIDKNDKLSVADVTVYQNGTLISEGAISGVIRTNNSLSINPGVYNYFRSGDSIEYIYYYKITDNHDAFVNQTFTLTISGRNDNPYWTDGNSTLYYPPTGDPAITQSTLPFWIDLLANAADSDANDTLSVNNFVIIQGDQKGITRSGRNMSVDPTLYQHLGLSSSQQPEEMIIKYTYTAKDIYGQQTPTKTMIITIKGENDCPTVTSSLIGANLIKTTTSFYSISLLARASDIDDNDILTTQILNVTGNTIGITLNGAVASVNTTYYDYLNSSQSELITYEYDISDGHGASVRSIASITIRGSSQAPTFPSPIAPNIVVCNSTTPSPSTPPPTTTALTTGVYPTTPISPTSTSIATTGSTVTTTPSSTTTSSSGTTGAFSTSPSQTTAYSPSATALNNKSSSDDENSNVPLYAGLGAGIGLTACAAAAGLMLWKRRQHKKPQLVEMDEESSRDSRIKLTDIHISGTATPRSLRNSITIARSIIGGKYEIIGGTKITQQESNDIFEMTGKRIPAGMVQPLGKGQFGEILLARNVETNEYVAMKVVKGRENVKKSKQEDLIHSELSNKNLPYVMKFYDSVEIEDDEGDITLYQFMPLGINDGKRFSLQLQLMQNATEKATIMVDVTNACLTALHAIHQKGNVTHLDFKDSNLIIFKNGPHVGDFGCAQKSLTGIISEADGDTRYFSPDRLYYCAQKTQKPTDNTITFNGWASDAWALGITLIEIFTGKYPFDKCDLKTKIETWNQLYFENKLGKIPELKNPEPNSLWFIIKGLVKVDPKERLAIEKALNHPLFKTHKLSNPNAYCNIFLVKKEDDVQEIQDAGEYLNNQSHAYDITPTHVPPSKEFYYHHNRQNYHYNNQEILPDGYQNQSSGTEMSKTLP